MSLSIGETDGPVGVAALARALSYGFNAIPVVVTDTSLIEPMLIVFLGVIVGGIVIAMFLPIFKLNEVVSQNKS